ncbi:uncharacterized protein LOC142584524 [Dermacentor variabilis]|uniref:uncharacterized protein LOC142584524 n=1 Tax=Dermacentor variabilis TaxID=34621 RepID=UPI003F5C7C23
MHRRAVKFRSKHPFGKAVKRSLSENFKKGTATPRDTQDVELQASDDGVVEATTVGLTCPTSESGTGCNDRSRVRHDTTFLQPSEAEEQRRKAADKTEKLGSTAATERKKELLADSADAQPLGGTPFTILCLDAVNALLEFAKCKTCSGGIKVVRDEREYGLAVKLHLVCDNCDKTSSAWSSPRVDGTQKVNPFIVNVLAARAMQATGNRQTALNDVFAAMNVSHRGLHTKTWQAYVKTKLTPAANRAAQKLVSKCAQSVRDLYAELHVSNPGNIAVSYDGSWMTRGHSSHVGVGTVIELFSGLVLDYVVLSNYCAGCESGPKEGDPSYETWAASHVCQKNTTKKAGEMEVEAALILLQPRWTGAVMATFYHITANDTKANHSFCPPGPSSWCKQNAAKARGEPAPRHPRNLPPHVGEALLPIFERLSEKKLLERCLRGKTQNNNESLHSMIWALSPKRSHASLFTVEAAVAEAVMKFNSGNARTSAAILTELSLNASAQSEKRMLEKDLRRAEHQYASVHVEKICSRP